MGMQQVRYFLAFCETLNFTRAAETWNVPADFDFGRLVRPHLEQMTFSIGPSQWSLRGNLVLS
jgi:hypothetical protein